MNIKPILNTLIGLLFGFFVFGVFMNLISFSPILKVSHLYNLGIEEHALGCAFVLLKSTLGKIMVIDVSWQCVGSCILLLKSKLGKFIVIDIN
jgi:hypothetical protein